MKIDSAKTRLPKGYDAKKEPLKPKKSGVFNSRNRKDLVYISVDQIIPYKNQSRTIFNEDDIVSLSNSIKDVGILNPLILIRGDHGENKYEVISGERRWRAAILAKLRNVPAFIIDEIKDAEKIALVDNLQREDLHPLEFAKACNNLIKSKMCATQQEVADILSISRSKVVEAMKLLNLPSTIQEYILENAISSRATLREISKASNEQEMLDILLPKKNVSTVEVLGKLTIVLDKVNNTVDILNRKNEKLTQDQVEQIYLMLGELV